LHAAGEQADTGKAKCFRSFGALSSRSISSRNLDGQLEPLTVGTLGSFSAGPKVFNQLRIITFSGFAADTTKVNANRRTAAGPVDWSLSLQVFLYLQVLDVLTTWLGFRLRLSEASPFIHFLMRLGPTAGLLGSKVVALLLGAFCVWRGSFNVIRVINYWYAAVVVWNLALIVGG
jgi:hypothetical protein